MSGAGGRAAPGTASSAPSGAAGASVLHRVDVGDGLALAVHERGAGPPVVVLHGFTGAAGSMRGVCDALAATHRVLAVDLVGHGASDAPRGVARYAMDDCVAQLARACGALGVERAAWVGYSMGGRTALQVAVARPALVGKLVLVGATAGIADPAARAERVASDEALAARIEERGVEAFVDEWMALPLFASQARLGRAALAQARRERLRNVAHGLANSLRGMGAGAQRPVHDALVRIACPVCLVVGEEDAKFRAIAEALLARLGSASRSRIEVVPEAGHAAHLENPSHFAAVVGRFLAASPDAGEGA